MSDSSIYELEDIIWDEFGQIDDHIVPHSSDENVNERASKVDSRKKPRFELNGVSSNPGDKYDAKCVSQEKEETDFSSVNIPNNTMLEKGSWSHTPDNMFSGSCDSDQIKEVKSLASENTRMSNHCFKINNIDSLGELCSEEPILSGRCTAVDSNSSYPLTHISQTQSDLRFIDNTHEDKESSDLLYYSWPDIGNFEDVDRMFRGCDSSFGLGNTGNEDEMGWFSASDAIEGSEDASKSNLKFSCPDSNALRNLSEDLEPSELKNEHSSINYSNIKSASVSYKASSRLLETDEPASPSHLSFVNGSSQISEIKGDYSFGDQGVEFSEVQYRIPTSDQSENDNLMIHFHKKQQKQKQGKREDQHVETGGSLRHNDDLQKKGIHLSYGDSSHKSYTSVGFQKKQNIEGSSFDYLHANIPFMQSDYHQPSDQIRVSATLSGIKSENKARTSLSQKESFRASNELQHMEGCHDFLFEATDIVPKEMRGKLQHQNGFQLSVDSNLKNVDWASICNPASAQTGNEFENQSDVEGVSIGIPAGSLNVQGSSSMNSGLNEVSLEMTSFRQLQQVMEQLDLRTKLRIRDSLYRLARSAEQRNNYADLNGGRGDGRAGTFMTKGANKCTGFMDIETDTNPIDRTIAHLLFHRPSDASVMPSPDALSLKLQPMIPGSVTGPPMMVEKSSPHEESASRTDRKVADQ